MPRAYDTTSFDAVPIGSVVSRGTSSLPPNFLACTGSPVSRTTYPELFAAIGITYGAGDGVTTFNLPNLVNRTVLGSGVKPLATAGGAETVILNITHIPQHCHAEGLGGGGTYGAADLDAAVGLSTSGGAWGINRRPITSNVLQRLGFGIPGAAQYPASTDQPHENMPPYQVCQWAIRVY